MAGPARRTRGAIDGLRLLKAPKIVSALVAVLVVNSGQAGWAWSPTTIALVLGIKMLEASVADAAVGDLLRRPQRALVMLLLVEVRDFLGLQGDVATSNVKHFLFPLTNTWVALYTSWNAAFCYGVDFAWSFRLVADGRACREPRDLGQPKRVVGRAHVLTRVEPAVSRGSCLARVHAREELGNQTPREKCAWISA